LIYKDVIKSEEKATTFGTANYNQDHQGACGGSIAALCHSERAGLGLRHGDEESDFAVDGLNDEKRTLRFRLRSAMPDKSVGMTTRGKRISCFRPRECCAGWTARK
jgi:hypothetical protein